MIDYVIISSDDNSMYKDFYPIVSKRWNDIGLKTYYINITTEDSIEENEFGIIHKIKALDFVSTGFQSQVVRLFSANLVKGNLLMSDIDMLPINQDYFYKHASELDENNIIIYSGQPYGNVPYYPMCYVLSNSNTFRSYLDINNLTFSDYCSYLMNNYGEAWNTDEKFMYDKFQNHLNRLVIKNDRDFARRIDRSCWKYDINLLKSGHYIDSHMLRPYSIYKEQIDILLKKINNE